MALIKCPECGGEVSSAAHSCVHCGFRFKACPECGTVYSAEAAACPRCGFCKNPKPKVEEQKKQESATELSSDSKRIEERLERDYAAYKKKYKVYLVLSIMAGLCFLIIGIMFFTYIKKDPLDMLLTYLLYLGFIIFLLLVAGIFGLIASIHSYKAQKILCKGAQCLIKEKLDAYEIFVRDGINPKDYFEKEHSKYGILSKWAFLAEQPSFFPTDKKKWLLSFIVSGVFLTALLIDTLFLFIQGAGNAAAGIGFNFGMASMIVIYVAIGVWFIGNITIGAIFARPFHEAFETWANSYIARKKEERGISA